MKELYEYLNLMDSKAFKIFFAKVLWGESQKELDRINELVRNFFLCLLSTYKFPVCSKEEKEGKQLFVTGINICTPMQEVLHPRGCNKSGNYTCIPSFEIQIRPPRTTETGKPTTEYQLVHINRIKYSLQIATILANGLPSCRSVD